MKIEKRQGVVPPRRPSDPPATATATALVGTVGSGADKKSVTFDGDKPKPAERPVTPPLVGAAKPSPRTVAVKPSLTATFSYSLSFGAPPPAPATTLTFGRCRAVSVPNLDATERETRKHANAAAVTANAAAAAAHAVALKADPKAKAPTMAKVDSRPRPACSPPHSCSPRPPHLSL